MSRKQRPTPGRPERPGASRRPPIAAAKPAPSPAAMAAVETPLNEAIAHHRAGRFIAAESLYRQVLAAVPEHGDARHLLGMVLMQQGEVIAQGASTTVLTESHITQAYQQPVSVIADPVYGSPLVIPLGRHRKPTSGLRVV